MFHMSVIERLKLLKKKQEFMPESAYIQDVVGACNGCDRVMARDKFPGCDECGWNYCIRCYFHHQHDYCAFCGECLPVDDIDECIYCDESFCYGCFNDHECEGRRKEYEYEERHKKDIDRWRFGT